MTSAPREHCRSLGCFGHSNNLLGQVARRPVLTPVEVQMRQRQKRLYQLCIIP